MLFPDLMSLDARPTAVLLHSSGSSSRQWHALSSTLAADFNVLTPEFHGHGGKPAWTGARPMTLADEIARLQGTLDVFDGPVHLVGHSYGGAVALALALQRPHALRSVSVYEPVLFSVLISDHPDHPDLGATLDVADEIRLQLARGRFDLAAQCFIDFWSDPGAWAALSADRRQAIAVRMPAVLSHFDALFSLGMRARDLRALRVPVQLLHGSATRPVARRVVELLARAMPQTQTLQLPGLGHMGPVASPAQVNPHIAAFLTAHGGTAHAPASTDATHWQPVARAHARVTVAVREPPRRTPDPSRPARHRGPRGSAAGGRGC